MNKPIKPNITIPQSFAENGVKTDFDDTLLADGFNNLRPDVLAGDNLNKLIDDSYKGLNYTIAGIDDLYKGAVLYSSTETYSTESLVFDITGISIRLYHSIINNNIGRALTDKTAWEEVSLGNSMHIGQTIFSLLPITDAGLHLLDGSVIDGSGIYKAFVDYIKTLDLTASCFCTESDWQASVTQYGVCGKFVYDATANTVRLPKVTGIVEGTTDVTALGSLVEAGLPNITGQISIYGSEGLWNSLGALYDIGGATYSNNAHKSDAKYMPKLAIDASRSSSIYGNSSTVQPQTIKGYYYIVVATSAKTDIEVDIDNVVTDLNNKVDISNMVDVTNWNIPDYANNMTYNLSATITDNGVVYGRVNNITGTHSNLYVNGSIALEVSARENSTWTNTVFIIVEKGDVITSSSGIEAANLYFAPFKGGN